MSTWPTSEQLQEAILQVLSDSSDPIPTSIINDKVATILSIPQDLLEEEDVNCSGTEYSYRMRWARTNLKLKGKIVNVRRGFWGLPHDIS